MKKLISVLLAAVTVLPACALLSGCKGTEYPVEVANYTIKKEPSNVVVLDAATADILSYMGYERKFAGRSEAVDQEAFSAAPSVGSASEPDVNQVQFLGAEIVFSGNELTDSVRQNLENAGIQVIKMQQAQTAADVETVFITIGKILGGKTAGEKEGKDAYDRLTGELDAQKKEIEGLNANGALNTICYLYLEDGKLKQLTNETYGNVIMSYTNCINVAVNSDQSIVDPQTLAGANPDYIFYADEETLKAVQADAFLSKLKAIKNKHLMQIPLKNMCRPGFTAVDTLKAMIDFIYNGKAQTAAVQGTTQPATKADDKKAETTQPATKADDKKADTTQPATKAEEKPAETTKPAEEKAESVAAKYEIKLEKLTLEKDDEDDNVQAIQQRLFDLGYITDDENVTGYYGEVTEKAVKDFQKKNGIKETGKADNATLTAMFMSNAKKAK